MRYAKTVAVIAGFGFITLALFVQGLLPALLPESRAKRVSRVVRTDLGKLEWLWHDAGDYTALEQRGRQIYIREGCWYCHSQYVRPVAGEQERWGPVSQAGEYAFDVPHLFSTRRIGPDLTRVGLKYGDDWHYAHHYDPRLVVPDSNMPAFPWLYHELTVGIENKDGGWQIAENPDLQEIFSYAEDKEVLLMPNPDGLAFARQTDGKPVLFVEQLPGDFDRQEITIVAPTDEAAALVAYIQKLGMNRGQWRSLFEPQRLFASQFSIPPSEEWAAQGKAVYERRCIGCHGAKGDGNGPAATFMNPRPRDFRDAVFKFRVTPSGTLPTEGDLFRTITRGVRGTAMPTWHMLSEKNRLAVIQYIKTFSDFWQEEFLKEPPVYIPDPPEPTEELVQNGRSIYINEGRCWTCHGGPGMQEGEPHDFPWGEGPSAPTLKDDWGFPIEATDFTRGIFKSGPDVKDIFRTMTTGLNGTPMPSFSGNLTEEQRWAISYYLLSLSAYTDVLHRENLDIAENVRAALDDPRTRTTRSRPFDPVAQKPVARGERHRQSHLALEQ